MTVSNWRYPELLAATLALLLLAGGPVCADNIPNILLDDPRAWADQMVQDFARHRIDEVKTMTFAHIEPGFKPSVEATIDRIATEIGNLGEPELVDMVKGDAYGTSILVYRYYLAFSRGEYFLGLSFHKHMGGWALHIVSSGGELTAVLGVN